MGPPSILVVEDEWAIGELVVVVLTSYGYQARHAYNGAAALNVLAHAPMDLVITDLMMPVVTGSELLHKIRCMDRLAKTPVIVMSALPEDFVRKECPLATCFLGKPFTTAELLLSVRTILA